MMTEIFGNDLSKWLITKAHSPDGRWHVCPPLSDDPLWWTKGRSFPTGADALAAFSVTP